MLLPGVETPWDTAPIIGISKMLGYRFYRPAASGWATMGDGCRAQAAVSASSPSSARMWQACWRILRASDRAARLPPQRSFTWA